MDVLEKIKNGDYEVKNVKYPKGVKDQDERRMKLREYREEENRLNNEFKKDLEEEFELTNYSKKDAVFRKAWEDGHSSGLTDVYHEYEELSELIEIPSTPSL